MSNCGGNAEALTHWLKNAVTFERLRLNINPYKVFCLNMNSNLSWNWSWNSNSKGPLDLNSKFQFEISFWLKLGFRPALKADGPHNMLGPSSFVFICIDLNYLWTALLVNWTWTLSETQKDRLLGCLLRCLKRWLMEKMAKIPDLLEKKSDANASECIWMLVKIS